MRSIVVEQDNFHYMKLQPRDGTLYTVIYGYMKNSPDNMYIAIGPGDMVRGGYFFRLSSGRQLALDMHEYIQNGGKNLHSFMLEHHLYGYHATKLMDAGKWTRCVAILLSLVLPNNDFDFPFIGDVHNNDIQAVEATIGDWLRNKEERRREVREDSYADI